MNPKQQVLLKILRAVEHKPEISQRELARELGGSHGKAYCLIAALIEKCLININNFKLADGSMGKVTYLLTPEGIKNRVTLIRSYMVRKEVEYEALWHVFCASKNADLAYR